MIVLNLLLSFTVYEDKETKLIAQRNIANIFFAVVLNMQI